MPLHIVKLCVGCDSVEDLENWIKTRVRDKRGGGEHKHRTRMIPKRIDEVVDGGSLYWVIRGAVQVRQRILAIRPFRDTDGVQRCHIVLDPATVLTEPQPRRPFQGWRYLTPEDAPRDLAAAGDGLRALPPALRRDLAELGLL